MKWLVLLLFTSTLLFSNITLNNSMQKIDSFHLAYFYDANATLNLNSVTKREFKTTKNQFTFGYQDGVTWFKFEIQNNTDTSNLLLYFSEPFYETFTLYEKKDQLWSTKESGLFVPLEKRDIHTPYPIFKLKIPPQTSKTYYLKAHNILPFFGEFKVCTTPYFLNHSLSHIYLYASYFGGIVVILLFNIFLFFILKDRIYAYYSAYVFFTAIFIYLMSGLDLYLGLAPLHYKLHAAIPLLIISLILFSDKFLDIKRYCGDLYRLLRIITVIFSLLALLIIYNIQPWYQVMHASAIITLFILLYVSFKIAIIGHPVAKYYLYIMMIYMIALVIFSLMVMGLIPNNSFTRYSFLFISFVEIASFSLILANKFNKTKNEIEKELEKKVHQRTLELEDAKTKLKEESIKDPLTNLYNRRHLSEIAQKYINLAKRYNHNLSTLMLDIDKFKKVNDTYGHKAGDMVILEIANQMQIHSRDSDSIFRYGGEEFLILMPKTSLQEAIELAERIRIAIEEVPIHVDKNLDATIRATVSIGVSSLDKESDSSIEEIIKRADVNLYKAKEQGRNRVI